MAIAWELPVRALHASVFRRVDLAVDFGYADSIVLFMNSESLLINAGTWLVVCRLVLVHVDSHCGACCFVALFSPFVPCG